VSEGAAGTDKNKFGVMGSLLGCDKSSREGAAESLQERVHAMNPKINEQPLQGADQDEQFFLDHPEARQRLRPADSGEWPEGNELLTSPPLTLIVQIQPRVLLKLGVWRNAATAENTLLQLSRGRISVSTYQDHLQHNRI
jgi:hypothetical protein